ncbi:Snf7-domain-containing protein [Catenaria anguillulae PL171]|uniref:Snf7-domain-containing protein n=1 Tax=Catenaria anguillulae PL171 TaxID=765915 RepID=A0A1Y2HSL9_9FUNG|nr:Snf7-domain-containing protein [Catenaria anguillulae PL171]
MSKLIKSMLGIQTPEEQVKKWRASLRAQDRVLDRQIRSIDAEEAKVKRSLKDAAKKGNRPERLHTSKAQLNSVSMQLGQQLAVAKVAGALEKSTEIMKAVNSLVKLPEINMVMQDMAREMMKAGVIEEMIEDTISGLDEEEVEEEAEEEVNKILFELTDGLLGQGGQVGAELQPEETEEVVQQDPELIKRLDQLRMPTTGYWPECSFAPPHFCRYFFFHRPHEQFFFLTAPDFDAQEQWHNETDSM